MKISIFYNESLSSCFVYTSRKYGDKRTVWGYILCNESRLYRDRSFTWGVIRTGIKYGIVDYLVNSINMWIWFFRIQDSLPYLI